jgi:RNA polymerase sigma-70 factor, ECF subfamily
LFVNLLDRRGTLDVSIQWPAGNGAVGAVLEKLADEKLMARFQKGRLRAFEILFARHRDGVFRFILRFTRNRETSEDLLQDVFLRVVAKKDSFQQRSKFTTWLYTIARNLCIDHLRKMRHRNAASLDQPCRPGSESEVSLMDRIDSKVVSPDKQAHEIRLREHIARAVEELRPEQREVFLMREESGLPFDEIAAIVDAPLNTVKSRMRYALQNLRDNLVAQGVEL